MERKSGGYRTPSITERVLSIISEEEHASGFSRYVGFNRSIYENHPAPYPVELAERLIRMFSFVGDTVLDPFMGTGQRHLLLQNAVVTV